MEKLYASIALTLFSGTIYLRYRDELEVSVFFLWVIVFFSVVILHFFLTLFFKQIDHWTSQQTGWKLAHLNFFDESTRDKLPPKENEIAKQDKSRPTMGW